MKRLLLVLMIFTIGCAGTNIRYNSPSNYDHNQLGSGHIKGIDDSASKDDNTPPTPYYMFTWTWEKIGL